MGNSTSEQIISGGICCCNNNHGSPLNTRWVWTRVLVVWFLGSFMESTVMPHQSVIRSMCVCVCVCVCLRLRRWGERDMSQSDIGHPPDLKMEWQFSVKLMCAKFSSQSLRGGGKGGVDVANTNQAQLVCWFEDAFFKSIYMGNKSEINHVICTYFESLI